MPKVFISYRREDTSGEAGRLANDLAARFGRSDVFMDVDAIAPGANFEDRIMDGLQACQVALILIGKRWLSASSEAGPRLEDERDYVRFEILHALQRPDLTVVPVLVEGATMPAADALPEQIATLAKLNAVELSNRRWREDVRALSDMAQRYDAWWWRAARQVRARAAVVAFAALLLGGVAIAIAINVSRSSDGRSQNRSAPTRQTLLPASEPSSVDVCSRKLRIAVNGTVAPLGCTDNAELTSGPTGGINSRAWQYFANGNLLVMSLGSTATPGRVLQAVCSDLSNNKSTTIPKESQAYDLAAAYYGWKFSLPLEVDELSC